MSTTTGRENGPPTFGVTWGGVPRMAQRGLTLALGTAVAAGLAAPTVAFAATPGPSSAQPVSVIVRELPGTGNGPEQAVAAYGGTVERELSIIGGVTAKGAAHPPNPPPALPGGSPGTPDARPAPPSPRPAHPARPGRA